MNIIPAIDLKEGQCVRLLKGDFSQITRYDINPIDVARAYKNSGATQLHIVDLDGAKNQTIAQNQLITNIAQSAALTVQTGGGIRTQEQINTLLSNGIQRIVIGSLAVNNPTLINEWRKKFGNDRIVIALDVRLINDDYYCATQGWKINSGVKLWECLAGHPNLSYLLCTDIDLDGTLRGPNIDLYKKIKDRYPNLKLQASGGIGRLMDLKKLSELDIDSVIIGKALYEKCFTLEEALDSRLRRNDTKPSIIPTKAGIQETSSC